MAFRSVFVLLAAVAAAVAPIDLPGRHFLSIRPQTVFAAEPAVGMLTVQVVDEAGQRLPARVHLRDAAGRYLFAAGQTTRQRAVYKGTQPVCGDWFYTDGSFRIDVGAGEAQIDIAHGPAYATVHDAIPIVAGQNTEKTYTLRRLIDPLAMGWYSADEHLHQMPEAVLMLAEDLPEASKLALPGTKSASAPTWTEYPSRSAAAEGVQASRTCPGVTSAVRKPPTGEGTGSRSSSRSG